MQVLSFLLIASVGSFIFGWRTALSRPKLSVFLFRLFLFSFLFLSIFFYYFSITPGVLR